MAIDEKRWGAVHAAPYAASNVFADFGCVGTLCEVARESIDVKPEHGCIADKMLVSERILMLEQKIVHRPESPLRTGGFCCLGRSFGMRMGLRKWEMAIHKTERIAEPALDFFHDRMGLPAVGALVVSKFHE